MGMSFCDCTSFLDTLKQQPIAFTKDSSYCHCKLCWASVGEQSLKSFATKFSIGVQTNSWLGFKVWKRCRREVEALVRRKGKFWFLFRVPWKVPDNITLALMWVLLFVALHKNTIIEEL